MGKSIDYTGRTIGVWKVLRKTEERDSQGRVMFQVLNTRTNEKCLKTSNYLSQFIKYNCKSDVMGRPRKYIIIKLPINNEGDYNVSK